MERGWLEWRRGDASEQSGEIATRQPLQLYIIFSRDGVDGIRHSRLTMAMLLRIGE